MSVINKVQLLGHLGKEPIVKTLSTGKMARFSLATDESYLNREGNRVENTQWHSLVAWGEVAEQVEQSLKKGSRIQLYGKIANRSFETKEGVKKYSTEIVVTGFEFA
jgi:single-strand DNA-binding protein